MLPCTVLVVLGMAGWGRGFWLSGSSKPSPARSAGGKFGLLEGEKRFLRSLSRLLSPKRSKPKHTRRCHCGFQHISNDDKITRITARLSVSVSVSVSGMLRDPNKLATHRLGPWSLPLTLDTLQHLYLVQAAVSVSDAMCSNGVKYERMVKELATFAFTPQDSITHRMHSFYAAQSTMCEESCSCMRCKMFVRD
eukprot:768370-Hanusia_phi.AAC.5